jgi:hypothetical protein
MDRKALEKRTIKRTKMVLGVKLSNPHLHGRSAIVHTLDISSSGAKVGALREWIEPGTMLDIHCKHLRAHCTVIWSRRVASGETQIGIELLGHGPRLWGLDLDEHSAGIWLCKSER